MITLLLTIQAKNRSEMLSILGDVTREISQGISNARQGDDFDFQIIRGGYLDYYLDGMIEAGIINNDQKVLPHLEEL